MLKRLLGWFVIALLFGVYSFGKISLAHFNPAVTIGYYITGHITKIQVLYYFAAEIIGAFLGSNPKSCRSVSVKTRDLNNVKGTDTGMLIDNDIRNISACHFANNKNPITGQKCREGFSVLYNTIDDNIDISKLPDDYIVQFFYGSVSVLALYMLYKLNNR